jgi:DNA-directed RNA polymerase subunit RPC12/RpoP
MRKNSVIHIVAVAVIAAFMFVLPPLWGWTGLPFAFIAALIIVTIVMVRWHTRHTGYRCPACGGSFMISPWTDFLSPHLSGTKMLRCPDCMVSGWCEEIDPVSISRAETAPRAATTSTDFSSRNLYTQITLVLLLYAALWLVTLYRWTTSSMTISAWHILKIPVATAILPIMHFVFCFYAIRHAYRSRIYAMVTIFVAVFLLLAFWTQLRYLSQALPVPTV